MSEQDLKENKITRVGDTRPTSNGMNKYIKKIIALGFILGPVVVYAQGLDIQNQDFKGLVGAIIENIAEPAVILILSLAVVFFLWNIAQFIRKGDQPEELEKFKSGAIWGIVAIFVMVSMWGLVHMLVNTFTPTSITPISIPGAGTSVFQSAPYPGTGLIPGSSIDGLRPVNLQGETIGF